MVLLHLDSFQFLLSSNQWWTHHEFQTYVQRRVWRVWGEEWWLHRSWNIYTSLSILDDTWWSPEKSAEDEVLVGAVGVVGDVVVYFYWILDEHVSDDGHHQLRDPVSITRYQHVQNWNKALLNISNLRQQYAAGSVAVAEELRSGLQSLNVIFILFQFLACCCMKVEYDFSMMTPRMKRMPTTLLTAISLFTRVVNWPVLF